VVRLGADVGTLRSLGLVVAALHGEQGKRTSPRAVDGEGDPMFLTPSSPAASVGFGRSRRW
jgi:hypothetical protein